MIEEDDTHQVRTQVAPPRDAGGAQTVKRPPDVAPGPGPGDETKPVASREVGSPPGPGDEVGRYRIERVIGEGGMGRVYRAEDPQLGRFVALKILRPTLGEQADDDQKRLLREAQALAKLTHANLVRVYDVGTHGDQVFIAMEYVEGLTLDDWIRERPRPWRDVVKHLAQAGNGLQAVHDAGLVHRDFKPGNVMVAPDGRVLVLDLGLARQADESERPQPRSVDVRAEDDQLGNELTRAGGIIGTPSYMAPEQHLGVRADARTDQFSFCVSLYEGLYGQRPFTGRSPLELMEAAIDGLRKVPPAFDDLPLSVRSAVYRGLRPERSDRFASMKDLVAVLEEAVADKAPSGRRWTVVATGLAVTVTAVVTWKLATPDTGRLDRPPATSAGAGVENDPGVEAPSDPALPRPFSDAVGVEPGDGVGGGGGEELPSVDEIPPPDLRLDAGVPEESTADTDSDLPGLQRRGEDAPSAELPLPPEPSLDDEELEPVDPTNDSPDPPAPPEEDGPGDEPPPPDGELPGL